MNNAFIGKLNKLEQMTKITPDSIYGQKPLAFYYENTHRSKVSKINSINRQNKETNVPKLLSTKPNL